MWIAGLVLESLITMKECGRLHSSEIDYGVCANRCRVVWRRVEKWWCRELSGLSCNVGGWGL